MPASAPATADLVRRWAGRTTLALVAALSLYLGAAAYTGPAASLAAARDIGAWPVLAGAGICAVTLLMRFGRWHFILLTLGHRLPGVLGLRIYLAGLALSSTPGKLGETLRSLLLLPSRVPVPRSLAAFFADRLADVLGVAALGALAGLLSQRRLVALEVIAVAGLLASLALAQALRRWPGVAFGPQAGAWRWIAAIVHRARPALDAWATAWRGWRPGALIAVAMCAYGLQALVLAMNVARVAPQVDTLACVAIFTSSVLIGAASLLPGGLGAMDAAVVVQLTAQGVPWPEAVAATLAMRLSTLWLTWLIGLGSLLSFAIPGPMNGPQDSGRMAT